MSPDFLQFLYELSQNNNKDWFEKNKPRYEKTVKKPWEDTVNAIIEGVKAFEPDFKITAKDCIPRIYRDIRFSADKRPLKENTSAMLMRGGRKNMAYPGYYMSLEFGSLNLGGGAYFLEKEPLHKVRTAIAQDPEAFKNLLEGTEFTKKYVRILGEKNKVLPAEFKEAAVKEPLLFNKQFYFMVSMDPEVTLRPDFVAFVVDYFKAAHEVNLYFRKVLGVS
jgi:uncharacterized protein (TIGR02453 family)